MNKKGFILLEVLLSLFITGTVIIAAIQGMSHYLRAASSTGNINNATILSQQLLSRIALNQLTSGMDEGTFDCGPARFVWTVKRTDLSADESQYDITITWNEHGTDKDLKLTTTRWTSEKHL